MENTYKYKGSAKRASAKRRKEKEKERRHELFQKVERRIAIRKELRCKRILDPSFFQREEAKEMFAIIMEPLVRNARPYKDGNEIEPFSLSADMENVDSTNKLLQDISHEFTHEKRNNRVRERTRYALRTGKISKPEKCEICGRNTKSLDAHHKTYEGVDAHLNIQWLCIFCHLIVVHQFPFTHYFVRNRLILTQDENGVERIFVKAEGRYYI